MADVDFTNFDKWSRSPDRRAWPNWVGALRAILTGIDQRLAGYEPGEDVAAGALQIGDMAYLAMVDGDFWLTINAFWDGENWQRVDAAEGAWGLQLQVENNMVWENYKATTFWHAQAAANPIGGWATVGGWEMVFSFSSHRNGTVGGAGFEMDGFGAVAHMGYGRVQHALIDGVTYTGVCNNQFLDFSGRDTPSAPSWRFGAESNGTVDKFSIDRGAGGTWAGWTRLFEVRSDGAVFLKNASAPATPTGGAVLYVESGSLKVKGSSGTVTVLGPA